jgi:diguanylate cyclase (GGDEF)-like protein/PAS domain S-box-containing protein
MQEARMTSVRGRLSRMLHPAGWVAGVALLLALGGLAGWSLIDLRRDAMREATTSGGNLVQALQQDIGRTIATYDLSVRLFGAALTTQGIEMLNRQDGAAKLLGGFGGPGFLSALLVTDAQGRILASNPNPHGSGTDVSQRDYFIEQRDHPDTGLYISRPFVSLRTGEPLLAVSRRLPAPEGHFAGVIAATLRLDYFADLARRFHLGPGAVLLLTRTDGTLLARVPPYPRGVGAQFTGAVQAQVATSEAGSVEAVSKVDGERRLYSFARVAGLPLAVSVGVTTAAVYRDWVHRASVIGPALALLTLLGGGLLLVLAALRQELARRLAAERLARRGDAIYRLIAEHSNDVVTCLDAEGVSIYVSPAIEHMLGVPAEALVGRPFVDRVAPEDRERASAFLADLRHHGERGTLTYRCQHRAGREIWMETSFRQLRDPATRAAEEVVGTTRDVTSSKLATDALRSTARELALLAATDPLTGLGNRRAFDQRLQSEWLRARRDGSSLALLMVDADRFKAYNDTYGHQLGDAVLRDIARVLREHARRPADFAARYGGEEFALILPATELEGAMRVAEEIRRSVAALAIPHAGGEDGRVTVSIGVATSLGEARGQGESLVQAADAALYEAKRLGRDRTETARLLRARG